MHDRGRRITVWSKRCTHTTTIHSSHCHECHSIQPRLADLAQIARDAKKGTNYKYLTHDQMRHLLIEKNEELNKLKLESLNLGRRLATFARKMDDFERLLLAIATHDVPRIHAIIETALRNGASIRAIVNKIYDAFEGLHTTKGFTDFEKDLGILIYRLGGRSLVYAMNHALNLPSLRTICNSGRFIKIAPTIGPIRAEEIRQNIQDVMLVPRSESKKALAIRSGVTIMMDEVAIEEQAVYFPHANKVGGLCSKHTTHTPLDLKTHESAAGIVEGLAKGDIHFGTEMAFVAAQCANETQIYPLLCAPSCKKETADDMRTLFEMIMEVWAEEAQAAVGDIWDFATDGDKLRRKAGYAVFVQIELGPNDEIYITLSGLPGLNLFTGPCLITLTFDWRHIIKRVCTLIRHLLGMALDNGRIITPACLRRCLLLLPGQDEASIERLVNPDDPQHVPHALELLEAIVSLRTRRTELNVPVEMIELNCDLDSISLFSYMVEALLNAFTEPTASLSFQIQNLSLYAHLCFVFFRTFRLAFMSNQLYGDSQTMVKNIVFTVAKQQNLDPTANVNAYRDGTDPVENHFGFTREVGGHNSAMNYKQAVERSGWACDINGVHDRNPGLHAGHRRRNVTRTEIKDHLNEHNFTGDLVAGNCDLAASWRHGRHESADILKRHSRLPPAAYDFETILARDGLDFLRPLGDGIYMGVLDDIDRSLPGKSAGAANPSADSTNSVEDVPTASSDVPAPPPPDDEDSTDDMVPDVNTPAISFEELLQSEPSEPSALKLEPRKGVRPEDYLRDASGKFVHKASICRLILNKEFVAKSKNRGQRAAGLAIKRVRCFTKLDNTQRLNGDGSLTGASFIPGDLFITLIRDSKSVSLAVVRSTDISVDGKRAPSVNINSIKNEKTAVKLTGQIYKLKAVTACSEDMSESAVPISDEAETLVNSWTWVWTGESLMGKSTMKGTNISTDKPHTITVPGHLVEPISPKAVDAHGRLTIEEMRTLNSTGVTWAFSHDLLRTLILQLWERVEVANIGLKELPALKELYTGFPYTWATGLPGLLSEAGTALMVERSSAEKCLYCTETPSNWRGHMGSHVIRKLRGSGEIDRERKAKKIQGPAPIYPPVDAVYPCGFCGRSNRPECRVTMKPKGESFEIHSNCRYVHNFNYKPANTGSAATPSRNVPVICHLCPTPPGRYPTFPGIWRYNMEQHLRDAHPEYASPLQPEGDPLPFKVWESARIDYNEQFLLGIPEFLIPPMFTSFIPGTVVAQIAPKPQKRTAQRK
ncbi:hypothetical protein C8R47DRAFT_996339 [Mycena vitilis]|nr:hypothetical protein C8R47DRAFT_996339 [Mycena vitilis]